MPYTFINIDKYGNILNKTKQSHPYDYDPITLYLVEGEVTNTIYNDRLSQWDYKKRNLLCKKHFNNEGDYWDNREPNLIEKFLRDWVDDQNLKLISIIEYCNSSNGYPYWRFDFQTDKYKETLK